MIPADQGPLLEVPPRLTVGTPGDGWIPADSYAGTVVVTLVLLPSVWFVGMRSFVGCTNLKEVQFPSRLQGVGHWCFAGAPIERIILPDSIAWLEDKAFSWCTRCKEVVLPMLPGHTIRIEPGAFDGLAGNANVSAPMQLAGRHARAHLDLQLKYYYINRATYWHSLCTRGTRLRVSLILHISARLDTVACRAKNPVCLTDNLWMYVLSFIRKSELV